MGAGAIMLKLCKNLAASDWLASLKFELHGPESNRNHVVDDS
jgi:hypothetical protein